MLKRIPKLIWQLIVAIVVLLGLWQGIVWAKPRILELLNLSTNNKYHELTLSTNIIIGIFALAVLCIIYIAFSLPFIFKKEKFVVIGAKPPKDFPKLPIIEDNKEEILPPEKDMINILKSMSVSNNWTPADIEESFNLSKSDLYNYLNLIVHNGYAKQKRYYRTRFGGTDAKIYEITPKGSGFLVKYK